MDIEGKIFLSGDKFEFGAMGDVGVAELKFK